MPVYAGLGVLKRLFYGGEQYAFMVAARAAGITGADMQNTAVTAKGEMLTVGEEAFSRRTAQSGIGLVSGTIRVSFFIARKTGTYTQLGVACNSPAGATPTLIKYAIFSVAADDTLTCIGVTANDTTLLSMSNTEYVKATAASFNIVAGQRYAFGVLVVTAASTPTIAGNFAAVAGTAARAPRLCTSVPGQTDMPAVNGTIATGLFSASNNSPFGFLVP